MKLRIAGNSLRLRLGRMEVARLASEGLVEAWVEFGAASHLTYRLLAEERSGSLHAAFREGVIEVSVPKGVALAWAHGDDVSLQSDQDTGSGARLTILVEKDFQCLHRTEREPDAYPNPEGDAIE